MNFLLRTLLNILVHWKSIVIILTPLVFLPLALIGTKEAKCGYVVLILAIYWMTEAIPLPITSLLPVVLFPMLGVLPTEDICVAYLKETNMMFIGGLIVAIAVEHCNLHKRIALKVLLIIGTSPRRLMLGFMLTTMFLSMWISNTACTAMMVPIVSAVLDELKKHEVGITMVRRASLSAAAGVAKSRHDSGTFDEETRRTSCARDDFNVYRPSKDQICYFLGVAYAANIGGTGTMTGTGTNLTFKGLFESLFPDAEGLNFASWMVFNVPLMLFNCFIAWIWLQILFMGLLSGGKKMETNAEQDKAVRTVIRKNYDELGSMTYHEANVLALFLLVVFLWFFRAPEFIPGWAESISSVKIKDATPAMIAVFLLFVLPADLNFLKGFTSNDRSAHKPSPALLNWKIIHEKLPWGLVILLGGGFALAAASNKSGLSKYLGQQLVALRVLPPVVILMVICLGTTFMTEVSSNTAIANILLPVLAEMSTAIHLHPLYLMMPATLCCSYAFMLPVATPPNAIVVAASNMKTVDMMKAGIGMNFLCCACLFIVFPTFGSYFYNLDEFPQFAINYLILHNDTNLLPT